MRLESSIGLIGRNLCKPQEGPTTNLVSTVPHISQGLGSTFYPASYNAQISMNPLLLRGAKIVHFFTKDLESRDDTIAHIAAKRLKSEGILDKSALQSAIASGNPWTRIDSYRKAVAARRYARIGTIALERLKNRRRSEIWLTNRACKNVPLRLLQLDQTEMCRGTLS